MPRNRDVKNVLLNQAFSFKFMMGNKKGGEE